MPQPPNSAIVVFTRLPRHEAKALVAEPRAARHLHTALILKTLATVTVAAPQAAVVLACDGPPPDALRAALRRIANAGLAVHTLHQRGHGFGQRFTHALQDTAAMGYDRLVAVGTDTPSLSVCDIERALLPGRLCFGPAFDGGFYLIGLDRDALGLLDGNKPWCTPRLLASLLQSARTQHHRVHLLGARLDLDTPAHARRCWASLQELVVQTTGYGLAARFVPPKSRFRPVQCLGRLRRAALRIDPTRGPPIAAT